MIVRTVACLPAVTGQWLNTGGGAIKHNSAVLNYNRQALQRTDLLYGRKPRSFNMNRLGSVLLETKPPVRSLFIYGTNPAVVAPEANKVRKCCGRIYLQSFTICFNGNRQICGYRAPCFIRI